MNAGPERAAAPGRMSGAAWGLLIVYAGSLFLWQLGSARTFTGHECFVAQAAREMLATGDWLVPRIGGQPWLEKPPLPHWVVASLGELAGEVSEFTARLPSVLAGLAGVLILAGLAARWFGPTHGLLTGLVQATTVYTATYARLAEADIYLWALVVGCLAIFGRKFAARAGEIRHSKSEIRHNSEDPNSKSEPNTPAGFGFRASDFGFSRARWFTAPLAFLVLLGLTQMVKGPLFGAVLVLAPCAALLVADRAWGGWRWFLHGPGLVLCAAISAAWPLAILVRYPETADLWWLHTFGRLDGDTCLNPKPAWYYFTTWPWQVLPWTLVMLPAMPGSLRRAWDEPGSPDRFLWLWFGSMFAVLSAVQAKHHHYLIYALPPCSFWAADGLLRLRRGAGGWLGRPRVHRVALAVGAIALAGFVLWAGKGLPEYRWDGLALGTLVLLGGGLTAGAYARGRYCAAGVALFAAVWAGYAYVHTFVTAKADRYAEETALLRRVEAQAGPGRTVLVYGVEPSRVLLYLGRPAEVYQELGDLEARGRTAPGALIVTSVGHEEDLRRAGSPRRVDQTPQPRHPRWGAYAQLAVYQVAWHGANAEEEAGDVLDSLRELWQTPTPPSAATPEGAARIKGDGPPDDNRKGRRP